MATGSNLFSSHEAKKLVNTYGGTTQPVYINSGVPTNTTYTLGSTVSAGTANRLVYYSGANTLSASGHYASTDKIAINSTSVPSYNLYVNGTSYFNGNTTHNGIDYFANGTTYYINNSGSANLNTGIFASYIKTNNTYPNIRGNGTGVYFSIDDTWDGNHGNVCIEANTMRPSSASSTAGMTLGVSGNRWGKLYVGTADSYGSTGQPIYWNAGVPAAIDWHIGNSSVGEHNANSVTYNFCGYYTSNGPTPAYNGIETTDGTLYAQGYSSSWVTQLAQDYRTGYAWVRSKNNGSWTSWKQLMQHDMTSSVITNCNSVKTSGSWTHGGFTNRPSGVSNWGTLINYRLYIDNNNYHRQLFLDCYDTNRIWTRSCNGGTWTSWDELVRNTGTWGISITGNAATATKATQDGSGNTITSKYVTLDTNQTNITGEKRFTKAVQCYRYTTNNNLPAITMDKPGNYYVGIGANGSSHTIHFGPCADLQGSSWVATSTFNSNVWDFQGKITCSVGVYSAVWNDYAEYRQADSTEPGRCIREVGDDTLIITTERLQPGCEIISDTFGFAIGETEECKTPVASSGRVLAYPYEDREEFRKHIGEPVCSGPNGTVSIMTPQEEKDYPSRIIGTISAVPDYEEWGTGNVQVNGRVWIRIR